MIPAINPPPTHDTRAASSGASVPGSSKSSPQNNDSCGLQAASFKPQRATIQNMQHNEEQPDAGALTAPGFKHAGNTDSRQSYNGTEPTGSVKSEREATAMTSRSEASGGDETSIAMETIIRSFQPGNYFARRAGDYAVLDDSSSPPEVARTAPANDGGTPSKDSGTHVDELRALLGRETVLLPIPSGRKGPIITGWQNTKLEDMKNKAKKSKPVPGAQ